MKNTKKFIFILILTIAAAGGYYVLTTFNKAGIKQGSSQALRQPDTYDPSHPDVCPDPAGLYPSFTVYSAATPTCLNVSGEQFLRVVNRNNDAVAVSMNGVKAFNTSLKAGEVFTASVPFQDLLSPGVHNLTLGSSVVELWVKPTKAEQDEIIAFLSKYFDTYQKDRIAKNFSETKKLLSKAELNRMEEEKTSIEINYTNFTSHGITGIEKTRDGYVANVQLFNGKESVIGQNGDVFQVPVFKEDGQYKTSVWYFTE